MPFRHFSPLWVPASALGQTLTAGSLAGTIPAFKFTMPFPKCFVTSLKLEGNLSFDDPGVQMCQVSDLLGSLGADFSCSSRRGEASRPSARSCQQGIGSTERSRLVETSEPTC